jgi:exosortase
MAGSLAIRSSGRFRALDLGGSGRLVLLAGIAALVLPTLASLARFHWTTENGAHGPIILVSGLWLLWRARSEFVFRPHSIPPAWLLLLVPLLGLYVVARSAGFLGAETASLWLILVLLGFAFLGPAAMRKLWFATLYLGFLIKPPHGLAEELTQPLKIAISEASVGLLHWLGYPIASSGVLIQIAQYQLLVEQACAGMGSLFTLLAMGFLLIHLTGLSRARSLVLTAAIIPIALLANFIRVNILVLLTYHSGDAVAQSFAHDLAGIVTFVLSLGGILGLSLLLERSRRLG